MIKRGILLTITILAAACMFSACARKAKAQPQPELQNTQKEGEKAGSEKAESEAINQTDSAVSVCIDYVIESYENVQKFSYDLFLQHINDQNPVLSPVSAYLALSLAGCGADGSTRDEFYSVLGNDMMTLSDDMMNRFGAAGDQLNLSIANSAWIDDQFIVKDEWIGTVKSLMDAESFQADLYTEQTMNQINHWIDEKTNGLIDNMLAEPLDEQTRLALLNTIYFKGKWVLPFEAQNTHKEDFYLQKGQERVEQVDMMNLYMKELDYISNDFVEGVILPYQQNDTNDRTQLAFVALKPIGTNVMKDVYSKLTNQVISDMIANKQTQTVNLKLPKFEVTFDTNLNQSLINIGLKECFEEGKANFDQLGKTKNQDTLFINLVRQKAKIIVDEEGTEAAAATEILMMDRGGMIGPDPKELYFNEPFLYMIMDMETELPLFIGVLDCPVS